MLVHPVCPSCGLVQIWLKPVPEEQQESVCPECVRDANREEEAARLSQEVLWWTPLFD